VKKSDAKFSEMMIVNMLVEQNNEEEVDFFSSSLA
jgi:hypothetical protein